MSFHAGCLPTRFQIVLGRKCSNAIKHKPPFNYIIIARYNVQGHRHGLLDLHALTKESLTYKCRSPKD